MTATTARAAAPLSSPVAALLLRRVAFLCLPFSCRHPRASAPHPPPPCRLGPGSVRHQAALPFALLHSTSTIVTIASASTVAPSPTTRKTDEPSPSPRRRLQTGQSSTIDEQGAFFLNHRVDRIAEVQRSRAEKQTDSQNLCYFGPPKIDAQGHCLPHFVRSEVD